MPVKAYLAIASLPSRAAPVDAAWTLKRRGVAELPRYCAAVERELRFEDWCDEFLGRRASHFVIPVASEPRMDSGRAGALESDWR
jgi:hypothetical protein